VLVPEVLLAFSVPRLPLQLVPVRAREPRLFFERSRVVMVGLGLRNDEVERHKVSLDAKVKYGYWRLCYTMLSLAQRRCEGGQQDDI
jgi:hypothetical protein